MNAFSTTFRLCSLVSMVVICSCSAQEESGVLLLHAKFGGEWSLIDPVDSCFSLEVKNSERIIAHQDSMDYYASYIAKQYGLSETNEKCLVINVVKQTRSRAFLRSWIWELPITNVSPDQLK